MRALEVKLDIMRDRPTNRPTDGHEDSLGNFTFNNSPLDLTDKPERKEQIHGCIIGIETRNN